jgi:cytochrome c biogenesis protein CcdA
MPLEAKMLMPMGARRARMLTLLALLMPLLVLLLAPASEVLAQATGQPSGLTPTGAVTVTLYHGIDCHHCADERPFLAGLQTKYPGLVVEEYEVWRSDENLARLKAHAAELGFVGSSTPVTIIGDNYWIGFNETVARDMDSAIAAATSGHAFDTADTAIMEVPFFGEVDVAHRSLIVGALIIGFIDGVNPCSLWVLSVLLAVVLHSGSRGRVVIVGITFLVVTAGMYALYMTGMYSALDYIGQLGWIRRAIALVALVFGLIHLKDYFWFKTGPSLTIDDARKPGLYKRMRAVGDMDRSLPAVLGGTVVLALGVSLLETPCTAGLPLLWANLLASQGVAFGTAVALFGVYMAVFLLDELVLFGAAVITLRAAKVQEEHGRMLKLVSGAVMVTLALAMAMVPAALESVVGTVQVFVVAGAFTAVILALSWIVRAVKSR